MTDCYYFESRGANRMLLAFKSHSHWSYIVQIIIILSKTALVLFLYSHVFYHCNSWTYSVSYITNVLLTLTVMWHELSINSELNKWCRAPLRMWQQQAVEELARNWPGGADDSKGISKLFQHTLKWFIWRLTWPPIRPWIWKQNLRCHTVCVGDEVDATDFSEKGKLPRGKTCGMMPERLHPSLQSSAKVANVS